MNDVSVLELFWFILKLLAALGLVSLVIGAAYLIFKVARRMLVDFPKFIHGHASTAVTVGWVLVIFAIFTAVSLWFKGLK